MRKNKTDGNEFLAADEEHIWKYDEFDLAKRQPVREAGPSDLDYQCLMRQMIT